MTSINSDFCYVVGECKRNDINDIKKFIDEHSTFFNPSDDINNISNIGNWVDTKINTSGYLFHPIQSYNSYISFIEELREIASISDTLHSHVHVGMNNTNLNKIKESFILRQGCISITDNSYGRKFPKSLQEDAAIRFMKWAT